MIYNLTGIKSRALYAAIRGDVLSGKLRAGEKLPSKRALAADLGVSVVTVQTAYEQLLAEGYITSRERSGYFVSNIEISPPPPRRERKYDKPKAETSVKNDFVGGTPPAELFPFSVWAKLMRKVLLDEGEHLLERVPCDGDRELKIQLSEYLYRARGIDADPRRIVIGAGAEYLYGIIVDLLGKDCLIAVENPGHTKISRSYLRAGARCAYIPVREDGADCGEIEKSGANAVHISPSHQFPTGAVMPVSSRARIISYARSRGAYVVEDDYDSEFRLAGKPLESAYSLCPDRVIYMNTFSKTLAPSMRLGYMVLPPELYERFLKVYGDTACVVPLFEQKTLAAMIGGGYFERRLSRLKNYYKGVRAELLKEVSRYGVEARDTGSGLHMTVKCALTDGEIKSRAEELGARVKCLTDYLISPADGYEGTAVLNYSGYKAKEEKGKG